MTTPKRKKARKQGPTLSDYLRNCGNRQENVLNNKDNALVLFKLADSVEHLPEENHSIENIINHITNTTQLKITDQYINLIKEYFHVEKDDPGPSIFEKIGLSKIKSHKLYYNIGLKSIEDLKQHPEFLTRTQYSQLKYGDDLNCPINVDEIESFLAIFSSKLFELDAKFVYTVCGEYRRGFVNCNEINIVVSHTEDHQTINLPCPYPKLDLIVKNLIKLGFVIDLLEGIGTQTFRGICQLTTDSKYRRIKLTYKPFPYYYFGIFYETGPNTFVEKIQSYAKQIGIVFEKDCMYPVSKVNVRGENLAVSSEMDIFINLKLAFSAPNLRI